MSTPPPLIVGPTGAGGISVVLDRIVPLVGGLRVGARPMVRAILAIRRTPGLVHLHTSLREHAFLRDTALWVAARGPTAVSWHGWDPALAARIDRDPRWRALFVRSLGRAGAHGVLTDEQHAALLRWGVAPERVVRLVNPVDPAELPTARVAGPPTALFLGRWTLDKGVVELVRGFSVAAGRVADLRLVVAGEGPARADVVREVGASPARDRIALAGWVGAEGRRRLLAEASVVVLPSASEAFPLAVAEALAAGVPVVATRAGAVPALVGYGGVLLDRVTPEALGAALIEVIERPPPGMGAVAERVRRTCDPRAVAEQWLRLYEVASSV